MTTTFTNLKRTWNRWEDGDVRWTPYLIWIGLLSIVAIIALGPEMKLGFTQRFFRAGIWTVLGIAAAGYAGHKLDQYYSRVQDGRGLGIFMFAVAALYFAALIGPHIAIKLDREAGIPDQNVYFNNGKVQNAWDSKKKNYYFRTFDISTEDSLYIVTYGEEPGYNVRWQSVINTNGAKPSTAPRANEDWQRPAPKNK